MKNLLILLFIPFVCLGQVKYILNDSILMQKLKFCYFGDTIIYNDLSDEFYQPLLKCRGAIKTYILTNGNNWYEINTDTPVGFDGNLVLTH